jgi:DNA-binding NarL/FixJ family response regulator
VRTRLVIADDSQLYLELLTLVLAELPQLDIVGSATDGRDAVRATLKHRADVALLDVEMPILSGLDAAKAIRLLRPQTNIVLHTGAATDEQRSRAEQLGLSIFDKLELFGTIELLTNVEPRRRAA